MKVLLVGFEEIEVEGIRILLGGLGEVKAVPRSQADWSVEEIVESGEEGRCDWRDRRFVIIHEGEDMIREVINRIKFLDLGSIIFATTTPTSLKWSLSKLLDELEAEDEYFKKMGSPLHSFRTFNVREEEF